MNIQPCGGFFQVPAILQDLLQGRQKFAVIFPVIVFQRPDVLHAQFLRFGTVHDRGQEPVKAQPVIEENPVKPLEGIAQINGNSGLGVAFGNVADIFIILSDSQRNGERTDSGKAPLQSFKGLLQLLRQRFPVVHRHGNDKYDQVTLSKIFGLWKHLVHFLNGMAENDLRRLLQHAIRVGIQTIREIFLNVIDIYNCRQTAIGEIPAVEPCTVMNLHIGLDVIGQKILQERGLIFLRHLLIRDPHLDMEDQDNAGIFKRSLDAAISLGLQAVFFK